MNTKIIQNIIKLDFFLNAKQRNSNESLWFDLSDTKGLEIFPQTGAVISHSLSISGHNGDYYDEKKEELSPMAGKFALENLFDKLLMTAKQKIKQEIVRKRERAEELLIEDQINVLLTESTLI